MEFYHKICYNMALEVLVLTIYALNGFGELENKN